MPCSSTLDCPAGFVCRRKPFSDGAADVCTNVEPEWNNGDAIRCNDPTDCYFEKKAALQQWQRCTEYGGGEKFCERLVVW